MHEIQEIERSIVLDKCAKGRGRTKQNKCTEEPRQESFVKMGWPIGVEEIIQRGEKIW